MVQGARVPGCQVSSWYFWGRRPGWRLGRKRGSQPKPIHLPLYKWEPLQELSATVWRKLTPLTAPRFFLLLFQKMQSQIWLCTLCTGSFFGKLCDWSKMWWHFPSKLVILPVLIPCAPSATQKRQLRLSMSITTMIGTHIGCAAAQQRFQLLHQKKVGRPTWPELILEKIVVMVADFTPMTHFRGWFQPRIKQRFVGHWETI